MTVNAKDLPTNNLYINEIEQNTSPNSLELGSGKEGEYTYSKTNLKIPRCYGVTVLRRYGVMDCRKGPHL